ncbi:MAG: nitrite reductase [Bacteroidota bacterium]
MSENPNLHHISDLAAKDVIELQQKIKAFKTGKMQEERFKHYRLTRGVYGQRQLGVHMFRTKIPYGKLTSEQLIRLADVSEKYTNGNLHLTTRQNIQYHYVKLDDSPAIWTELAELGVTAREACGNTVRNITASARAGIDPSEPFDVSPYVEATFQYFLRNPICQEMGRKIKIAFSSSDVDSAYTYFHDFGFIPKLKQQNGETIRGFKVVLAGGLGAQSMLAQTAYEFLPTDQIIPFMEATIRVFDRHGEREKRYKARMKFLLKQLGLDAFLKLIEQERKAIKYQSVPIDAKEVLPDIPPQTDLETSNFLQANEGYQRWLATNVFEQKQKGYYAVQVRVPRGDIHAERARLFARLVREYAANDIRITVNQGFLLRFIPWEVLPLLYQGLAGLDLARPGFDSIADVTSCPGTDTCNLGVTNSTGLAAQLEEVIAEEYPALIEEANLHIKISGCMNACGQHMAANIGFHGSSIKKKPLVIPAMQIVLGGGVDPNGTGQIADKVIKLPTKRIPDALRIILNDYEEHGAEQDYFNQYYRQQGKKYFYGLLKSLADVSTLEGNDFFDWGQDAAYQQAIGVGECAGVAFDVVGTIINDAREKIDLAEASIVGEAYADSIYHSYGAFIVGAKALLLSKDVKCNTHKGIINDFAEHYSDFNALGLEQDFDKTVLQIKQKEPSAPFAISYAGQAAKFVEKVILLREQQLQGGADKTIIDSYYKA